MKTDQSLISTALFALAFKMEWLPFGLWLSAKLTNAASAYEGYRHRREARRFIGKPPYNFHFVRVYEDENGELKPATPIQPTDIAPPMDGGDTLTKEEYMK